MLSILQLVAPQLDKSHLILSLVDIRSLTQDYFQVDQFFPLCCLDYFQMNSMSLVGV